MCSNPAAVRVFRNCGQKVVFYGFQRSREALFQRAFCLACARILLLFERFGTVDKNPAAIRVFRNCGQKIVLYIWIPKVTWGTFSACVLLSMCSKPAAVRVFRNCGQKIVFYGFQRSREALFRRAFCLACARILLLFECFGTADKRLFFMDSKGHVRHFFGVRFASYVHESCCCSSVSELRTKDCFLWIPKVTWGTFSACVSCCCSDKRLFFMDSKGHVRHFFGVRFAYHVLESCCCSSVSELRTKDYFLWIPKVTWGTFSACVLLTMCSNPAAVRVFRNCGQKIVFYGFHRSREALFRRAFCFACARLLHAAVRVFRNCGQKIVFYGFQRSREVLFRRAFCLACARILLLFESELRTKDCFLWIPKVTWGTFSACVLFSMCTNPAAVRVFRNCGQKIVFYGFQRSREALFRRAFCLPCARILLLFECFGTADKRLFFMDSKGHVRHFFGVRFA